MTDEFDRIPPNNLEAEMAVLGSMLQSSAFVETVESLVSPEDFYSHANAFFCSSIFKIHAQGKPVDIISVAEAIRGTPDKKYSNTTDSGSVQSPEKFSAFGGLAYLQQCANSVVASEASVEYYAGLVSEKASLRRLIEAGVKIMDLGYRGEAQVEESHAAAERLLDLVASSRRSLSGGLTMRDSSRLAYSDIEKAYNGEHISSALMTPWKSVNELTGGFHPGELVSIVASPGQGKTGIVLTLADWFGMKYGCVAFGSFEMSQLAISRRLLAMHSDVSAKNQKLGRIKEDEWEKLSESISILSRRNIIIFGQEASDLTVFRRELRAIKRKQPLRAVIVDHAGFIADSNLNSKLNEHERLDKVYRSLLRLADELECVVFAVQHMNRAGSQGPPTMLNIRGGGNIEGHSHAIIAPYRPDPDSDDPAQRALGELRILKCRDGEPGTVQMSFLGWRHLWLEHKDDPTWFDFDSEEIHRVA